MRPGATIALAATGEPALCAHCELPVVAGSGTFCCPGCEAVFHFIHDAGLDDYYRLRARGARRPDAAVRESFALYDEPAMRSRFVRDTVTGHAEADLVLEGLTCAACAWLIERSIARVSGVRSASVSYSTRRARVTFDAATAPSAIFDAVHAVGCKAWPFEQGRLALVRDRERRALLRRFLVAALGMMQVMMYAYPAYIASAAEIGPGIESLMRGSGLLLTIPVLSYSAAPFFRGAWRDVTARRLGMDVPIALGLTTAFAASAYATIAGGGAVYFDSVAMFVFLVTGGRYLEHLALERASRSLQRLAALAPASAHRLTEGSETESELVAAATLKAGDRVIVRGGDCVPADGIVSNAGATLSEALLTGESRPVTKQPGDAVIGGSVNCGDAFVFHVTHAGGDTVLSALRRMMEAAIAGRPRWVEMAHEATSVFVALVLGAAACAGIVWLAIDPSRALWIAVSVLIVTCPCALSLATPIAMTVATGALARRNVVVTSARAIEALACATDFVFDKTGTLTEGTPQVHQVLALGGLGQQACMALAAAIARHSRHPLDRAFAAAAHPDDARVVDRRSHAGRGIEATMGSQVVRLGRRDFVAEIVSERASIAMIEGPYSVVWLGCESGWIAAFRIGDAVRNDAREAIESLRATGSRLHLLTGDAGDVAGRVAAGLGIAALEARATPARKQAYVSELQLRGARVAVVGDGINDAPALAQADVSIAMGGGADLAQVRADAVLLSDSLSDLAQALRIARRARRVIRQNLAWALGYNLVVLPLAFAGMVTPLVAAIGMSASSLFVVANALRVR